VIAGPQGRGNSDLGRPAIDWEAAFAFYASLSPERRSYAAVAAQFGVSTRTVETHGRRDRWRERGRRIDHEATVAAERQIGETRSEQIAEALELIKASLTAYREQLGGGSVRVRPADLPRLVKMLNDLSVENTEVVDTPASAHSVESPPSMGHMRAVIAALHEAIGEPERTDQNDHHDHDDQDDHAAR
jgi:hypothetical protein